MNSPRDPQPEQEGVTKYELHFTPGPALDWATLAELDAWRTLLVRAGLIGRDPQRYGGVGFGNVSRRLDPQGTRFAVSGTQTGALARLDASHYSIVTHCDAAANRLDAEGPIAPSSESLTHGQLYALDPDIRFIFHVHAPELWRAAARLGIPTTAAHAAYGTPAMVAEVERLFRETDVRRRRLFAMGGHEDGVVGFGASAARAGVMLFGALAAALAQNNQRG